MEYSIQRLMPVIDEERGRHEKRKRILAEITEYLAEGEKILAKSREVLGEDDPIYDRFEGTMATFRNAQRKIESFIEKGKVIEDF